MFPCFLTFLEDRYLAECRSAIQCKLSTFQCKLSITYQEKSSTTFLLSSTAFKINLRTLWRVLNGPESEKCERFKDLKGFMHIKLIYMST